MAFQPQIGDKKMTRDRDIPEQKQRMVRSRPLSPAQKKAILDECFRDYKKDAK